VETVKSELETKINSVIVYQSGVQITLNGVINLNTGEQLITITNLPYTIDKESIRVKGIGNGKIININVEFNSKKEYKKEEHKKLQEEREALQKKINVKQREMQRLVERVQKYKSTEDTFYSDWSKAYAFGEVDLSNFLEFNTKINEQINSKIDLIEKLGLEIKDLQTEMQVLNNKISKLGPVEKIHNFYEVTVNLNVSQEGEFKFELRYTMTEAWWVPFYDATLTEDKAKLTMMANVYNRTGEDWEDVEIEISTASLSPIRLSKPSPMILKEYVPPVMHDRRVYGKTRFRGGKGAGGAPGDYAKADLLSSMDEDYDVEEEMDEFYDMPAEDAAPEPEPEIQASYAEVSENIGVQAFKIPNRLDIPSDKNPHPVNLTVQELETEKKYYWSSAASDIVIIRDKLTNGDLLLLAGNVKIYYLEEFLGETSIPVVAPKEQFKLGTRVSYDLKIDKKLIDRSKSKKAIKGKLKNNYEYKIQIKNLNEIEEDLVLLDRVPHSSHENIKVEIESMMPEQDKIELGILKWKFNLKGVNEKTINYKYYVEYKKGITVTPSLP